MTEPGERGGPGEPGAAAPGAWARGPRRGRAAWAVLSLAVLGVALLGALGWAGAAALGLAPAWTGGGAEPRPEPATPLEAAQAAGFVVQACPDGVGGTCLIYKPDWNDSRDLAEDMAALAAQADALGPVGLDLSYAGALDSLEPLRGLPLLHVGLAGATGVATLAPLRGRDRSIFSGASDALLATLEE